MKEEVEIFLTRAQKFHRAALDFFEKQVYDLAAFHVEQAFQLYLKYILAREVGYFPRTPQSVKAVQGIVSSESGFSGFLPGA